MALAQDLLVAPKMANHHRGLWGYHGERKDDGRELTIQSTGMGGPSAAIVLTELAQLGVRRAIRVGTCAALSGNLEAGELAVVTGALATDGTSRSLGATGHAEPAPGLTDALTESLPAAQAIRVATTDLFYRPDGTPQAAALDGAAAFEMEAAPLFILGRQLGVEVACVLTVVADADGDRIGESRFQEAELEMGRAAAAALAVGTD